jgi:hypothetical protein
MPRPQTPDHLELRTRRRRRADTRATLALKAGVRPKTVASLGHATIAVTIDTDSDVTVSADADAADLVAASIFNAGRR